MTRLVVCRKYNQELEGLDFPPMPGPKGEDIFNNISKKAWQAWMAHQTLLINEKRLSLMDPRTREYLAEQMLCFFENKEVDQAEGYVPETKK